MVSWKQFCFSDGEAIRQEGGAGVPVVRPSPPDEAGARQRETLTGRVNSGQILRPRTWPYHRYDRAEGLDPRVRLLAGPRAGQGPNSLRQNASI